MLHDLNAITTEHRPGVGEGKACRKVAKISIFDNQPTTGNAFPFTIGEGVRLEKLDPSFASNSVPFEVKSEGKFSSARSTSQRFEQGPRAIEMEINRYSSVLSAADYNFGRCVRLVSSAAAVDQFWGSFVCSVELLELTFASMHSPVPTLASSSSYLSIHLRFGVVLKVNLFHRCPRKPGHLPIRPLNGVKILPQNTRAQPTICDMMDGEALPESSLNVEP